MKKSPKVSIIIPVIAINDYILESVPQILKLDWPDFEILIFTDKPDKKHSWPKTRIIPSGKVGPAEKRDMALQHATGEIIAFLDDDAYPARDWLKKAIPLFTKDQKVGAVGGPAITPEDDGPLQKVSGAVYESYIGGGEARKRYVPTGKVIEVEDWPTVNLIIRKEVFAIIGGFDNTYWPGEDTKLCLDILNAGYKIVYQPEAIVYHHRRSDLLKHLKQVANYSLHRGYFAKVYPRTSRKLFYFLPTLFNLYLIGLILLLPIFRQSLFSAIALIPLTVYLSMLLVDSVIISFRWKNPLIGFMTIIMVISTHIIYGIKFVHGLLVNKLAR